MNANRRRTKISSSDPNINAKKVYGIADGPSRSLLFDSCKYAQDSSNIISLDFRIAETYASSFTGGTIVDRELLDMRETRITGIEHEDDSGFKFNIKGRCLARFCANAVFLPHRFTAFYNTNSRKGTITFYD